MASTMIEETSFIINNEMLQHKINVLKTEAIDRLASVADDLPKYKQQLNELITHFTVDKMLDLMNAIYRDNDFKASVYYNLYNLYFDEIEDLIHKSV
jgi:hypothetical protein